MTSSFTNKEIDGNDSNLMTMLRVIAIVNCLRLRKKTTPKQVAKGNQKKKIQFVGLLCNRHGSLNRATASIATVVLQDIGLLLLLARLINRQDVVFDG